MARSPLMQRIITLIKIAKKSQQKNVPAKEFAERQLFNRRKFLETSGKAAVAATVLAGCSKTDDYIPPENNSKPEIAIIGAGIAGLNAAYNLKKAGVESKLYDANTRTGGRIFTAHNILHEGLSTELGGEFIDSDHHDMRSLAAEFGFPLLNLYTHSELKLQQNLYNYKSINYSDKNFIDEISYYLHFINRDANSLSDIITYKSYSPTDKKFDSMNLEEYFDSINLHGWLRSILLVAYLGEYGLNTWDCNAINFLFLFGESPEGEVALYGESDERYKISGGNQKIVDALAGELKNSVYTDHKLVKLQSKGKGFELYFENRTKPVHADIVLLTLPFILLREVEINVELPPVKHKAIYNLGYGANSKLFLGFNGRPWRTKYNSVGMSYSDNGTQNVWDNSQLQPGSNGGLTVFLGGDEAVRLGDSSIQYQAQKYLRLINEIYPSIDKDYNNKAQRMKWNTYPYTKCGYSAWKVGQCTTIAGSERQRVGNLYFAGEHTSYNYQGYMNGGAETGRKAAQDILAAI